MLNQSHQSLRDLGKSIQHQEDDREAIDFQAKYLKNEPDDQQSKDSKDSDEDQETSIQQEKQNIEIKLDSFIPEDEPAQAFKSENVEVLS